MRGKIVVITGGAGFIGSNLADALSHDNNVVVVDNLSTGRLENIKPLIKARKIKFVKGDILNLKLMKRVCRNADVLYHYAALPSVVMSVKDPLSTNRSGIDAILTSLVVARDVGIEKVVYASSSAVYGDTRSLPIPEDAPMKPLSPYAVTKIAGERYCELFTELYGLETVSLRYFNVYGPRQDPESEYAAVIPRFITNALGGRRLTIYGDGKQTRDFLYVGDVVQANVLAAKSGVKGVFNISSGRSVSIDSLAHIVQLLTGAHAPIVHSSPRSGEILRSHADISKAVKELGFSPSYTLEDGLQKTISSYGLTKARKKR